MGVPDLRRVHSLRSLAVPDRSMQTNPESRPGRFGRLDCVCKSPRDKRVCESIKQQLNWVLDHTSVEVETLSRDKRASGRFCDRLTVFLVLSWRACSCGTITEASQSPEVDAGLMLRYTNLRRCVRHGAVAILGRNRDLDGGVWVYYQGLPLSWTGVEILRPCLLLRGALSSKLGCSRTPTWPPKSLCRPSGVLACGGRSTRLP
jgi:hypothetical protein